MNAGGYENNGKHYPGERNLKSAKPCAGSSCRRTWFFAVGRTTGIMERFEFIYKDNELNLFKLYSFLKLIAQYTQHLFYIQIF